MKRCPQCNRAEAGEALKFCRDDGTPLVSDSSSPISEAGAAKLGSTAAECETISLRHTTDAAMNRTPAPTASLPTQAAPMPMGGELRKSKNSQRILALLGGLKWLAFARGTIIRDVIFFTDTSKQ